MKTGDLVRFKKSLYPSNRNETEIWKNEIGILVEYKKWEKIASILFNGEVIRIRAEYVSKAGKKDFSIDNIS